MKIHLSAVDISIKEVPVPVLLLTYFLASRSVSEGSPRGLRPCLRSWYAWFIFDFSKLSHDVHCPEVGDSDTMKM